MTGAIHIFLYTMIILGDPRAIRLLAMETYMALGLPKMTMIQSSFGPTSPMKHHATNKHGYLENTDSRQNPPYPIPSIPSAKKNPNYISVFDITLYEHERTTFRNKTDMMEYIDMSN